MLAKIRAACRWAADHKVTRYAALAGAVLAIACHFLPRDYRAVCDAVASLCTP